METALNYLSDNASWIFSGIGILVFSGIAWLIRYFFSNNSKTQSQTVSGDGRGYQAGGNININEKSKNNE